jgi:DNA adenine methylase
MLLPLFEKYPLYYPPKTQLLKWVGNKQRFANEITSFFPEHFNRFYEPFLGSGAIIATVAPEKGFGSDIFSPLIEIWKKLATKPDELIEWYAERRNLLDKGKDKNVLYEEVKASFNKKPNGADFLYLSRSCYGGVIRFRKNDGYMSTPCGAHTPISVTSFAKRVREWHERVKYVIFQNLDYQDVFDLAKNNDIIYCDPPYSHSQKILYGAQEFSFDKLMQKIDQAKSKGVKVALSIDGHKKSGQYQCNLPIQHGLFEREIYITTGRSMLKRFQMEGQSLYNEVVADRLLLTY